MNRRQTIPKKKKCKKAKWLSEEVLQIAVKRREAKTKGEKERLKLMTIESVMPSSHLNLLLLPSIYPRIRIFPMSQFFASDGPSIGVSASASVLPMNTQD